ncbi:hypothetical protein [Brucella sp. IR073]|uniref:hypothetical protein n=1 Tax=unclassified Brucella TaxID=2632610 RepID=UPI003B98122A
MADVLVSIHGNRVGLSADGELLVDGTAVAMSGGSESVAWADVTGKPSTFPADPASVTAAMKAKTQIAALTNLTGTVGTANDAMTAVPAATAAATGADTATLPTLTSVNASITAINNNLADLQAKVNAIMAALKA